MSDQNKDETFTLHIKTDRAARLALICYASMMRKQNRIPFAKELENLVAKYEGGQVGRVIVISPHRLFSVEMLLIDCRKLFVNTHLPEMVEMVEKIDKYFTEVSE